MSKYLMKSAAAIVLGLAATACSHDFDVVEKAEKQSIDNAQATMGFYIPEDQDWKMTSNATANFSVGGASDEIYTVKIYSNSLFEDGIGYVVAKKNVQGGQNFTAEFAYPAFQSSLYIGLTDSKGKTTYKVADIVNGQLTSLSDISTAASTRAENKNLNEWGDPAKNDGTAWNVPPALTYRQKLRVRLYFQYHPNLTYVDPEFTNFFVQQVYKGNPATQGPYSPEEYYRVNGQKFTGSNEMDHLVCGNDTHINDFNDGEWNDGVAYEVLNTGANANDHKGNTTHVEGVTHPDQITLMVQSSTEYIGYGASTFEGAKRRDCCANAGAQIIDAWATSPEAQALGIDLGDPVYDPAWNRSFVGLDYEAMKKADALSSESVKALDLKEDGAEFVLYQGKFTKVDNFTDFVLTYKGEEVKYLKDDVSNEAVGEKMKVPGTVNGQQTMVPVTKSTFKKSGERTDLEQRYHTTINGNSTIWYYDLDMVIDYINDGCNPTKSDKNMVKNIGGRDYVFSDWIVTLTEANKNGTIIEDNLTYSYAFEDNRTRCDFDLNDVVLRVKINKNDDTKFDVTLVAAGCEYDNYVFLDDQLITWPNGSEVHDALGADKGQMVNTGKGITKTPVTVTIPRNGNNPEAANFKIWPYGKDGEYGNIADQKETTPILIAQLEGHGKAPVGIIVPGKWAWPTERTIITEAYSLFVKWASNAVHVEAQDWYNHPTSGKVVVVQ